MSDVYIARQPIFDKDMKIYGYKLLCDEKSGYFADNEDDEKSNASLIDNVLFAEFDSLTDGALGFIKFTEKLLLREAPLLFPKKNTIIEIPGDIEINENIIRVCKKIKDQGYILAIDDFDMNNADKYLPIIKHVDIIKADFSIGEEKQQAIIIDAYKNQAVFLAKNVKTRKEFGRAVNIGYKLFQGTFYSKPVTIDTKAIGTISNNLISILNELYKEAPNYDTITSAFERDVEMSYKLLRMVNSVYYGMRYHTDSLRLALIQLGIKELMRWTNVMVLKGTQNPQNAELIKASIIRGKMLALIAIITNNRRQESNYFISGMFSSIDILLNESMDEVVKKLPLGDDVCKTLLGQDTPIRKALDVIIEYEKGNWNNMDGFLAEADISQEAFMSLYVDAIKWQKTL